MLLTHNIYTVTAFSTDVLVMLYLVIKINDLDEKINTAQVKIEFENA